MIMAMTTPQHTDDIALMQRIINGDEPALTDLYEAYGGAVFNVAMHILKNRSHAEEVTQDLFFKIWQEPGKWDPDKGKLSSWLLTVTRYMAIDRLRKEKRQPEVTSNPVDDMAHMLGAGAMVDDPNWDNGRLLQTLLRALPRDQIDVIQLAFFKGYTHHEVADHLQIPLGTVKSRIRLALEKLREGWRLADERGI